MNNKILIIPGTNTLEKVTNSYFLFPLKDFSIGYEKKFTLEEIPNHSYIYINRLLDHEDILKFQTLLPLIQEKVKGIVFEDLGILEILRENKIQVETIFYPSHAICSSYTVNSYLEEMDTVILSNDITKEEIQEILTKASKPIGMLIYGHLPYMYSRRTLLTNYEKNFNLPIQKVKKIKEPISKQEFLVFEDEKGTILYDPCVYENRYFLSAANISYFLIDLNMIEVKNVKTFLEEWVKNESKNNTTSGFLNRKTIYRLPPKGGKND